MPNATELLKLTAAFGASVGVAALILRALSGWLGKVWANRILEQDRARYAKEIEEFRQKGQAVLERLRTRSERELLIHRVQFEKEFEVYVKLWSGLVDLVAATSSLRPAIDHVDTSKTEDQIKQERLDELSKAYGTFKEIVHRYRPFYAPEVHDLARQLLRDAYHEALGYKYHDPRKIDHWEEALANVETVRREADQVCDAIRQRIWAVGEMVPEADS